MSKLFGTDGIRGRANCDPVTPEVALRLGKTLALAFHASGHGSRRCLIGKDTRLSGYMLETAITSGLVSMGMDVFLVGPLPTPAVAHLTKSMGADVGIMLTASHNPFDDNGIKIFGNDGFKLSDGIEAEIERLVHSDTISSDHIRSDGIGKAYRMDDACGRYIEFAKATCPGLKLNGVKVVLDCANGSAYNMGPLILRELGAEVVKINAEPDGYNINNNCGATHPETVGQAVREHRADVGVAFDGDADRVIFCDAAGEVVDGDRILAMCALDMKARGKLAKDTLVVTSMTNLGLHEAMRKNGIRVEVTGVGDRQVIERMRQGGFNLGGEKSGHLVFLDHITTGDGIISALQVLRLMKAKNVSISTLADCMSEYPQQLISLPVKVKRPIAELPHLLAEVSRAEAAMGAAGRVVLRYSGTENKIRLLVETKDAAMCDEWTATLTAVIQQELCS